MRDLIGRTLGHHRIVAQIGAGGMGVVYRAHDERLDRDVAIKLLPEAVAQDPDRLARFEREAKLLASLGHQNIATLHGLEEEDGHRFLVMELVEGISLAGVLARGAIPVEEALPIALQIAKALETAHENGIIHRDLKPANVMVDSEGVIKVLDFGLAKAFDPEASSPRSPESLAESPTLTADLTRGGTLLGTAAYMSPEHARGKPVDKRTDIWAFGCVLYEMLTGTRPFSGTTSTEILAAIIKDEPDWDVLPVETPHPIRRLLRRCLTKDQRDRFHDIADVRIEMEGALAEPAELIAQEIERSRGRRFPWVLLGLIVAVAAISFWKLWPAGEPSTTAPKRFGMALPATQALAGSIHRSTVALSPNGTRLVYVGSRGESTQLYLREFDSFDAKPIPGTEGAEGPSFSPGGEWVAFFADGQLKKVSLRGGASFALCAAPEGRGASWGSDDIIVFTPAAGMGLSRVSAAGGTPQVVTTPENDERSHRWPEILPGSKAVLFTIWMPSRRSDEARIAVQALETDERRILVEGGTYARYAPTGHLVYARAGTLLVAPFNLARLEVTGPAVPLLEDVRMDPDTGGVDFSFSRDGTLVYAPGSTPKTDHTLVWVNRKGEAEPLTEPRRVYQYPSLSPNGQRMTVTITEGANEDVWVHDLRRGTQTRLTFAASDDMSAIWTPDGERLTFSSDRAGGIFDLFWKSTHTTGGAEQLTTSNTFQYPASWSPDGQMLAFTEIHPTNGPDVWVLPLEREHKPRPFLQTPFTEWAAMFSPDGRWLAYSSDESGRFEVYVVPFPGPGAKWQISTEGGREPVWARNGRELFYRNGDKMLVVAIAMQPTLTVGTPRVLFERHYERGPGFRPNYDVAPDGQRFVMIKASEQEVARIQLHVLLNWFDELRRRVRTDKD